MIKMKKSLIFLSLLLILCISLGTVSAIDIDINDIDSVNNTQNIEIVQESSNQKNVEITNLGAEPGSLNELTEEINWVESGATINLTKDYKYYEDSDDIPIFIDKSLTIDGQGHTIDGSGIARIFQVSADNVTLKNINFINIKSQTSGGAIYWDGASGVVSGCSFVDCSATFSGGAIYWDGASGVVSGCSFVDCSADFSGGAIYCRSNNSSVLNCSFIRCSSENEGGAIRWVSCADGVVSGCSFLNCSAREGGAIRWVSCIDSVVSGCSFVNCYANHGCAIDWKDINNGLVNYNIFDNKAGTFIYIRNSIDCDFNFNFFSFENNITSFPEDLIDGSTINNWVVLNISKDNNNYSIDYICNDGCALTKSMPDYNAKLNINGVVKEITIKNNTFKDNGVVGDYLLNSSNSGKVLARATLNWSTPDYNISTSDCVYGENAIVTVKINDSATGNITVKVDDGQVFTGIIDNGVAIIPLSNLNVGLHNLNISYSGDNNYYSFNSTANLTVTNATASFNVIVKDIVYGDSFVINITGAVGVNDEMLSGVAKVCINGNEYVFAVVNGSGYEVINDTLYCGNYFVNASLTVPNYNVMSSNTYFAVNRANTIVFIDVDDITYGNNAIVNVVVKGVEGKDIPKGNVTLFVNHVPNVTVAINEGKCSITIYNLSAGVYNIGVLYSGDYTYLYSTAYDNLTVNNATSNFNINVNDIVYGDSFVINITGAVGVNDEMLSGVAKVSVNGIEYVFAVVNGSGYEVVDDIFDCGSYFVNASLTVPNYNIMYSNTSFVIDKVNTTVSIDVENITYGEDTTVNVTINSVNGKTSPMGKVTFLINGVKKVAVLVKSGECSVTFYGLDAGVYNLSVVYDGNDNYLPSNATSSLIVNKVCTKFVDATSGTIYNGKYYSVHLLDNLGNALASKNVTIKIADKKYNVITDENGVAKVKLALSDDYIGKSLNVTYKFGGDTNFKASSGSSKIKVIKKSTKITNVTMCIIKNHKNFYVKLTTKLGKILANKVITMKSTVSGKTYKIKTNSKGIAKIDLWVKKHSLGKYYKYVFKYAGNTYYNSCTKTFKIKLVK